MKENFDIIIPVYNEGENIVSTINSLIKNVKYKINIFIIYDNDNDSTLPIIKDSFGLNIDIKGIKIELLGAHGAVITGFRYSNSIAALILPADDDYNSKNINLYFQKILEGYDMVCPSRFVKGGCMVGAPLFKYLKITLPIFSFIP